MYYLSDLLLGIIKIILIVLLVAFAAGFVCGLIGYIMKRINAVVQKIICFIGCFIMLLMSLQLMYPGETLSSGLIIPYAIVAVISTMFCLGDVFTDDGDDYKAILAVIGISGIGIPLCGLILPFVFIIFPVLLAFISLIVLWRYYRS